MLGTPDAEALDRTYSIPGLPTTYPSLPDIKPMASETYTLPNGMKVFLIEDHEVALVSGVLAIKGGAYTSPADKVGLAAASVAVARSSGPASLPGDAFEDRLDELAANIEAGSSTYTFNYTFNCRSVDLPEVLHLVDELARNPALNEDKLESYKRRVLNIIEHKNDNGSSVARREFRRIMYGKDSTFSRFPSRANVANLKISDIRPFLDKWQRPDTALMGIVGDFDAAALKKTLVAEFGDWKPASDEPPPRVELPPVPAPPTPRTVYLIDDPDASQSAVTVGELGIGFEDDDYYALDVLGNTLNGFGGKLFDEIRSRLSLAYAVGGGWDTPFDHQGVFVVNGETSDATRFLDAVQGVLEEACTSEPTAEAVADSREATVNNFVFNFASSGAQLQRLVAYDLLGLPLDYLYKYKAAIEKVTPSDALAAAQRHLHPSDQIAVVVGPANVVAPQLEASGRKVVLYTDHLDPGKP